MRLLKKQKKQTNLALALPFLDTGPLLEVPVYLIHLDKK